MCSAHKFNQINNEICEDGRVKRKQSYEYFFLRSDEKLLKFFPKVDKVIQQECVF